MNSINHVILSGYLGSDPEVKESQSGYSYVSINLATHQSQRGSDNQWETQTNWHRVVVFGHLAERCRQFLRRGSALVVEGTLSSLNLKNSAGQNYRHVTILANKLNFLGVRSSLESGQQQNSADSNLPATSSPHSSQSWESLETDESSNSPALMEDLPPS